MTQRPGVMQVYVSDLERSAVFYRDIIGLPLGVDDGDGDPAAKHYETYWPGSGEVAGLYLGFFPGAGRVTSLDWGFNTDDLDAVHARAVAAGVQINKEPAPNPYGGRRASYIDPDGNIVSVTQA